MEVSFTRNLIYMKRIRITHRTEYHYHQPVTFGPHRALMRPREGHDVRIVSGRVEIEPAAEVRWLRDIYGNSVAIVTFSQPGQKLRIFSEVDVDLRVDQSVECLIEPGARSFPFQYAADEQVELVPYRLPSYPHDGPALQNWLLDLYRPGQLIDTFELLNRLNTRIHESLRYAAHDNPGVQLPCETLAKGSGSCRDYAVLMMEAVRHWGFGARFVSGTSRWLRGNTGPLMPGRRFTSPARAGTASIPRTTSAPVPNTSPSPWPGNRRRPCPSPAPGPDRRMRLIGWKFRCRSLRCERNRPHRRVGRRFTPGHDVRQGLTRARKRLSRTRECIVSPEALI